jgi:hypothetical protein
MLLSILFDIHPQTAMNKHLENFNKWLFLMLNGCISVVGGTEIQILLPTTEPHKKKHYSVKKKQHLLNILVLVLLNGEIIYLSPINAGSCNQMIWNHENLQNLYESKPYGILGDGGFTFTWKNDPIEVVSAKPKKCPKKTRSQPRTNLSTTEKAKNTMISKYCIVVEATISL